MQAEAAYAQGKDKAQGAADYAKDTAQQAADATYDAAGQAKEQVPTGEASAHASVITSLGPCASWAGCHGDPSGSSDSAASCVLWCVP
jgi:hypothetical protein